MKLSVVIVSYNVRYYLEQCLHSVEQALVGIDGEIFVVDNHSRDDSVTYLTERFPKVKFIDSNHNLGFARANNMAIRQSGGEYVLLLNPDTFIGENVLREALAFMDGHQQAGGVGVMMHTPDGSRARESRRGLPSPMVSFLKMVGIDRRYYMSNLPWDQPVQIEVISGAFCLLRRKAIDEVGLLDEDFFMYGEDIDLSYRLLKGGWQNWYLPLQILHYKGESTQKTSFRYVHVFYQAMLIFFRKHYGHLNFLFTLPVKAAIYFRAFVALCGMLYWRMRRSLGFADKATITTAYEFRGSAEMVEECQQLVRRKGLTLAGNDDVTGCTVCTVFDTEQYSFSDILATISRDGGTPDHKLGTYSCRSKVLITPHEIIR